MFKKAKLKMFLFVGILAIMGVNAQSTTTVSDQDLDKFVNVFVQVQLEQRNIQGEIVKAVEESGLSVERFQDIQKAQQGASVTPEVTDAEMKQYNAVLDKMQKMQPKLEAKMQQIVKDNGMTLQKYQEVATAIKNDTALQEKLQNKLLEKQKELSKS